MYNLDYNEINSVDAINREMQSRLKKCKTEEEKRKVIEEYSCALQKTLVYASLVLFAVIVIMVGIMYFFQ